MIYVGFLLFEYFIYKLESSELNRVFAALVATEESIESCPVIAKTASTNSNTVCSEVE